MLLALYSIRPNYSQKILGGQKSVEFRRTQPNSSVQFIVIYESSPTQKIVGLAEVTRVVSDSPQQIWDKYSLVGGISKVDFFEYFHGSSTAYAIEIVNVISIEPISLEDAGLSPRAPQSFSYIYSQEVIDRLFKMSKSLKVS